MANTELKDYVQERYPDDIELQRVLEEFNVAAMQMKLINADYDLFDYAAKDIFTARLNIRKWQNAGLINSTQVKVLESVLIRTNKEKSRDIRQDHPDWKPEHVGQRILDDCNADGRLQRFPNVSASLPPHTAEGMLQQLANQKLVGWHPDWRAQLEKMEKWEGVNA